MMGQNPSTNSASQTSASKSELDQFVDVTYEETLLNVDGISSFNLGFDDIFCYEHYRIPELESRQVWCFRATIRATGNVLIELRKTDDLADITALSYTWGEQLERHPPASVYMRTGPRVK